MYLSLTAGASEALSCKVQNLLKKDPVDIKVFRSWITSQGLNML